MGQPSYLKEVSTALTRREELLRLKERLSSSKLLLSMDPKTKPWLIKRSASSVSSLSLSPSSPLSARSSSSSLSSRSSSSSLSSRSPFSSLSSRSSSSSLTSRSLIPATERRRTGSSENSDQL